MRPQKKSVVTSVVTPEMQVNQRVNTKILTVTTDFYKKSKKVIKE